MNNSHHVERGHYGTSALGKSMDEQITAKTEYKKAVEQDPDYQAKQVAAEKNRRQAGIDSAYNTLPPKDKQKLN